MKIVFVHGALVFGGAWWWHRMVEPLAALGLAETAYLGTVVLPILIGVAWTVLGYALWSYRGETIRRPARE